MGVSMSEEEAWEFLARSHTGILTTLQRDRWSVALPVWFVIEDRHAYVATPSQTKKLQRIAHDDRGSLLVESGLDWAELAAVHLPVRARVLDGTGDVDEVRRAGRLWAVKYTSSGVSDRQAPSPTTKHYSTRSFIRLDPTGPLVSWDNARIRLRTG